ncbi:hypothetical protein GCM10027269_39860 [Kribbella endophytica]
MTLVRVMNRVTPGLAVSGARRVTLRITLANPPRPEPVFDRFRLNKAGSLAHSLRYGPEYPPILAYKELLPWPSALRSF